MNHDSLNVSQRPTRRRWTVLGVACAASWFLYLHRYTWNFVRPALRDEYDLSNKELSYIYNAFNFAYTAGQVPSGILCDFFGPHMFMVAIIVLWSVAMPSIGLTGNPWGLGAARALFGISQAGCYPSLAKISKTWIPIKTRTIGQAMIATLFGRGGGAVSPLIMSTLLMATMGLSWRWALAAMGATGLVFAVMFYFFFRNRPEDDEHVNQAELDLIRSDDPGNTEMGSVIKFSRVLKNPSMCVFMLQQVASAGADFVYVALMGSYFLDQDVDKFWAGILVSLPLWGGAIGGFIGGFVNDGLIRLTGNRRWARTTAGFTGKFIAGLLMMSIVMLQANAYTVGGLLFFVKFFTDWSQPTVWGTCTDMGGRYSATVFSIINTCGGVGGIALSLSAGEVLDYYATKLPDGTMQNNYNPLFLAVAALYFLSGISWFFINCTNRLDKDEEPQNLHFDDGSSS